MINIAETIESAEMSQLLKTLLNNEQLLVARLDKNLNIIDANIAFSKACEAEQSELNGTRFLTVFTNSEYLDMFKKVASDGVTISEKAKEFCLSKCSEPKKLFWDYTLTPVMDEAEAVSGLIFTATDVTDHVRTTRSLHESQEMRKAIFEIIPSGIGYANLDGKILDHNKKMLTSMGYSENDQFNLNLNEIYHDPEDRKKLLEIIKRDGEVLGFETDLKRKDGTACKSSLNVRGTVLNGEQVLLCTATDINDRAEAENQVQLFKALADNAVDAIVLGDEGKIDYANDTWYKLFGYDPNTDVLENFQFASCFPETELGKLNEQIRPAVTSGSWQGTIPMMRKDGTVFEADLSAFGVRDKAGKLFSRAAIIRDVSDQKKVQEEILRNSDLLQTLIDNTPAVVYVKDIDGRYMLVNKLYEELTHVPREEVLGKTDYDLHPKEIADHFRKYDLQALNQRETIKVDESAIADGKTMSFLSYKTPLLDSTGEPYATCGVSVDITDREQMELALRESEERLRLAMSAAEVGTWKWDVVTNQDTRDANFNRILGLEAVESTQSVEDFVQRIHPDDQASVDIEIKRSIRERDVYLAEFRIVHPDGTFKWLRDQGMPFYDDQNAISYMTGAVIDITDRKKIDRELRQTEESLNQAQRIAGMGSWDWNIETDELIWTDEIYRIFGLKKTDFKPNYEEFMNSVHPDDREFVATSLEETLSGEKGYDIDHRIVLPDGTERIVNEQGQVTFGQDNKPIRLVGTVHDITERKRDEESLTYQGQIIDNINDSIVSTDLDGLITFWNKGSERLYGYCSDEIIGKNISLLYFEEDYAVLQDEVIAPLREAGRHEIDIRVKRKSGDSFIAHLALSLLNGADGKPRGMIGYCSDITDRKKADEALRASEERFRTITEAAADAIYQLNLEGDMLFINEAGARMFGYDSKEIKGINFVRFVKAEHLPEATKAVETVLSGERVQGEIHLKRKDGHEFPVFYSLAPMKKDGIIIGFAGISRDLSEQKARDEAIAKAQKLESVGILAGRIAHDFNNILVGVLGNISLAKSEVKPISRIYALLKDAEKSTTRAAGLTQQLLTFSEGGAPVKKSALIGNTIRESVDFALSGSNIVCDLKLDDDLVPTEVDHGQFSQVIQNLVLNADEAMPSGGIIKITAENVTIAEDNTINLTSGQYVRISVLDRGAGIASDDIEKIFDPFFTTKPAGSGLGLTTCFSIVQKHGGTMTVESTLGQGTGIDLYIPSCNSVEIAEKVVDEPKKSESDYARKKETGKFLIMDDEKIIRDLVNKILIRDGHTVDEATTGQEAVELYSKNMTMGQPYDAVILDLTVPSGMGGKETVAKLLEIDPDVKAIVCSGYATDPVMANYKDYGFSEVLPKPFKPKQLSEIVARLLITKKLG